METKEQEKKGMEEELTRKFNEDEERYQQRKKKEAKGLSKLEKTNAKDLYLEINSGDKSMSADPEKKKVASVERGTLIAQEEVRKKKEDEERINSSKYQENRTTYENIIVTIGPNSNLFDSSIE